MPTHSPTPLVLLSAALLGVAGTRTGGCGHQTATARIVGGHDVGSFRYPWFAALVEGGVPQCGGTLVTRRHVVTAAHCYKYYIPMAK